jgi:O-antigen ligase
MFAIPGTFLLVILILIKPQEFIPALKGVPLLNLALAMAVLGVVVDLRLKHGKVDPPPHGRYVIAFIVWCMLTRLATSGGAGYVGPVVSLVVVGTLFFCISIGVQGFRAFEALAVVLLIGTMWVASICFHQSLAPLGCAVREGSLEGLRPDGRPCQTRQECYLGDAEPGVDYECEKTGLLGTVSVGAGRVRYLGVLRDPNEVALTIGAGLSIWIARYQRRQNVSRTVGLLVSFVIITLTIIATKSRGGILVFLAVLGVYFGRRFGVKGLVAGGVMGAPLLLLGGRSGDEADQSADERKEALLEGFHMFQHNPILGAGYDNYTEHSHLTAHNSYMLAVGENGFVGLFLFLCILVLAFKICILAIKRYKDRPEAQVANVSATMVLAGMSGVSVGSFFLSFTYHQVLWVYLGVTGALHTAIRKHDPEFDVKLSFREHLVLLVASVAFPIGIRLFLKSRGL